VLEEKAIRGVSWAVLEYGSTKVVTVVSTFVLARLLVPSDFGLVAAAWLVVGMLMLFGDFGLGSVMALRQDLGSRALGTVFSLMLATSVAVAALIVAAAPLGAEVLEEPRLTGIVDVLAVSVLLGSVSWFYESILLREIEMRRRFAGLAVRSLVFAGCSITLAALGAGVWSLVVGQVAAAAASSATFAWLAPYRVRPAFDRAVARDVFHTGWGFIAQGAAAFLRRSADTFAIARVLGSNALGLYSMAFRLGELPFEAVGMPVTRVTFPGFARMRARGEDVKNSFLSVLRLVALVACPLCVLLSAAAEPFVLALLGDKWLPMVGALTALGIWGAVLQVEGTIGWMFNSVGEVALNGIVAGVMLVPLIPGTLLAAHYGGITEVAWVMTASMVLTWLVLAVLADRRVAISLREQWRALRPVLIACPVTWAAARGVTEATSDAVPALISLIAATAAGSAAYLAVVALVEPGLPAQAVGTASASARTRFPALRCAIPVRR
jgi:PST family polysaccharide transporter